MPLNARFVKEKVNYPQFNLNKQDYGHNQGGHLEPRKR